MSETQQIHVTIKSPETVHFDGQVKALTATNEKGTFDILAMHENFISIINTEIVLHLNDKDEKKVKIEKGIIKCLDNKVQIFLGI